MLLGGLVSGALGNFYDSLSKIDHSIIVIQQNGSGLCLRGLLLWHKICTYFRQFVLLKEFGLCSATLARVDSAIDLPFFVGPIDFVVRICGFRTIIE